MSRYYSCAELAAMRLPGLPTTGKPWRERVTREKWPSRPRASRGGGLEYLLPEAGIQLTASSKARDSITLTLTVSIDVAEKILQILKGVVA